METTTKIAPVFVSLEASTFGEGIGVPVNNITQNPGSKYLPKTETYKEYQRMAPLPTFFSPG